MKPTIYAYSKKVDGNKQVSTNFKVREFACQDGSDVIFIAPELVEILQKIRSHFGKPVIINSVYRTPSHNKKVDGASQSQHLWHSSRYCSKWSFSKRSRKICRNIIKKYRWHWYLCNFYSY